jgi:uncharacterized membrane protein
MSTNPISTSDVNDNDKLMAALAYFLSPLVSIIILLVDTMKGRPYQRYHAIQSLPFGILQVLLACVLGPLTLGFGFCFSLVLIIVQIVYAIKAYQNGPNGYFEIPVVTNFMVQQGWLQKPSM